MTAGLAVGLTVEGSVERSVPAIGEAAPDFELTNQYGEPVRLSSFRGLNVVLVFYPFAFSGICTGELCEIRDNLAVFEDANATVSPAWYHYLFVLMSAGIETSAPERQIESAFSGIAEQVGIGTFWRLTAMFDNEANLIITATLQCVPTGPRDICNIGDYPPIAAQ